MNGSCYSVLDIKMIYKRILTVHKICNILYKVNDRHVMRHGNSAYVCYLALRGEI